MSSARAGAAGSIELGSMLCGIVLCGGGGIVLDKEVMLSFIQVGRSMPESSLAGSLFDVFLASKKEKRKRRMRLYNALEHDISVFVIF